MDQKSLEMRLSKAKAIMIIESPFLASIVCSLPLTLDDSLNPPTLATNGKWIKAHPAWVARHTDPQLVWALGHEVMHCVFRHMLHRGPRNPVLWNIAGDYVINQLLETDPATKAGRPPNVLFDLDIYTRGGGTTEGVYNLLFDEAEKFMASGQWDACEDLPGDAAEQAEAEAEWKVKVSQAAASAKAAGKMGEAMERFVDASLEAVVDWKSVLRDFCLRRTRTDRSYARPSRRHLHAGLYLPGSDGVGMGDVMVAVDLSGSISQQDISEFNAEMQAIKEDGAPENIHVVYFHHEVTGHDVFGRDEDLEFRGKGSGGTAFSPIFKFADENDIEPVCCVVLTDLCCSDFGPRPDYPVLWVSNLSQEAPWGTVIDMRQTKGAAR